MINNGIKPVQGFLETCTFQTVQMKNMVYLSMKESGDTILIPHSSCIISKSFLKTHTNLQKNDTKLKKIQVNLQIDKDRIENINADIKRRKNYIRSRNSAYEILETGMQGNKKQTGLNRRNMYKNHKTGNQIEISEESEAKEQQSSDSSNEGSNESSNEDNSDESYNVSSSEGSKDSEVLSSNENEGGQSDSKVEELDSRGSNLDDPDCVIEQSSLIDPATIRLDIPREESKGGMIYSTENEGGIRTKTSNLTSHENKLEEEREKGLIKELIEKEKEDNNQYENKLNKFEYDLKENYEKHKDSLQKYEVKAIEFSWLFKSEDRKKFLTELARSPDLEIFSVKLVENIVHFMWSYYRIVIFIFVLIPYLIYFVTFIIYGNWIQEQKYKEADNNGKFHQANYSLASIILVMAIASAAQEIKRLVYAIQVAIELNSFQYVSAYFKSFWNIITIISIALNIFIVIADLSDYTERDIIPVLAIATLLMWFKLFYFGRMFKGLAGMVRMIHSVFMRLGSFMIILGVMILGFADIFYIMSRIQKNGFIGDDFWDALTYSYL
jgi:hypothetical protein